MNKIFQKTIELCQPKNLVFNEMKPTTTLSTEPSEKTTNGKAPIKKKPFVSKAEYAKQQSSNKLAMEAEEWENDL